MPAVLPALIAWITSTFRSRAAMQLEILALRHQLAVYQRTPYRPRLRPGDRILWSWIDRIWSEWRCALVIVEPSTVVAWQRRRFRDHWWKLCQSGKPGRPPIPKEVRDLCRGNGTVLGQAACRSPTTGRCFLLST